MEGIEHVNAVEKICENEQAMDEGY